MADTPASLPCPPNGRGEVQPWHWDGCGSPHQCSDPLCPSILPNSQSTESANGVWQSPKGNCDSSITLPTGHVLPRLHPVFILCSWLTVFVCHIKAGGCSSPAWAAQRHWAKANMEAGLLLVTKGGRAFGDMSLVPDVPTIRLSSGRGPQDAASTSQCPCMEHPMSTELALHACPWLGTFGFVRVISPPPKKCHMRFHRGAIQAAMRRKPGWNVRMGRGAAGAARWDGVTQHGTVRWTR